MRRFEYHEPASLAEASELLLCLGEGAFVFAGGTDLLVEVRERLRRVHHIVNIKRIPSLDELMISAEAGIWFGALVTAGRIERSTEVARLYPNLHDAVRDLGSIQVRNRATVVGNICRASPSADTIPPLIADSAEIEIFGPGGTRRTALSEFFIGPGRTTLSRGEIAIGIRVPPPAEGSGRAYLKHGRRKAMELATVGVAVSLNRSGGTCSDISIALGAVGPTVLRAPKAEAMLRGALLSPEAISAAANQAMAECTPISNVRSSADYRRAMVGVLTRRAVTRALEAAA
ncbi:MAG: FAD binding domain-containing protein [Acidiphilium sp.]